MLVTVFGKRGSGKTTVIRRMIQDAKKPVVVIDVLANYWPEIKPNNPKWIKCDTTHEAIFQMKLYAQDPKRHPGIIIVSDSDAALMVDFLSAALCSGDTDGGTLVFDEVDFVSLAEAPAFDDLVRYGRNKGVDLITGCRRPAELSKNITAGSDLFLCFRTQEPRDVDYFSKQFGDGLAEKLPRLPKHHGIFVDHMHETEGTFKSDIKGTITILQEKPLDSGDIEVSEDDEKMKRVENGAREELYNAKKSKKTENHT